MGSDQGKVLAIIKALYELKSSGVSWKATLMFTLLDLGFIGTQVEPDIWRQSITRENRTKYYELCLVYVDDILLASHAPRPMLLQIGTIYKLKEGSLGNPSSYLGVQVYQHHLKDGQSAWGMLSKKYVRNAVATVEALIQEDKGGIHLKTMAKEPIPTSY